MTMATRKQKSILEIRKAAGLNQQDFWSRYGVTQSGGSRYESGRNMPMPLRILLQLHQLGKIADKDIETALKVVRGK